MAYIKDSPELELERLRRELELARAERDGFRRLSVEKDDRLRYLEQLVEVFKEDRRAVSAKLVRLRELLRRTMQERDAATRRLKDVVRLLPSALDPRRHPRPVENAITPTIEQPGAAPGRVEIRPMGADERLVEQHWGLLGGIVGNANPDGLDLAEMEEVAGELIADMNPECLAVRIFPYGISGRIRPALHLLNAVRVSLFVARSQGYDESNLRCLGVCALFAGQPSSRWLSPDNTHAYARVIRLGFAVEALMSPDSEDGRLTPDEALRKIRERAKAGELDRDAVRALMAAVGKPPACDPDGLPVPETTSPPNHASRG